MTMTATTPSKQHDYAKLDRLLNKAKGRLFGMGGNVEFLGSLLCNHEFIWDPTEETAWCNSITIGINPDFFLSLTLPNRVALVGHEVWHTGYDHCGTRIGNRNPTGWNIAADYVINIRMQDDGFDFSGMKALLDPRFRDMTTEQVYDILKKEAEDYCKKHGIPGDPFEGMFPDYKGDVIKIPKGKEIEVKKNIVQAIQACERSKQAGSLPGEITAHIDKFLNPVVPWERELDQFFTELSTDDYTWRQPSRRYDDYLPSRLGDNGLDHLAFIIDASISMTNEQEYRIVSEIKSIKDQFSPETMTIIFFDTQIQSVRTVSRDESLDSFEIPRGGGTSLVEVEAWLIENQPNAAVIFSDMYVAPMEKNPHVPLIWVVFENPGATVPFGRMIHMDAEKTRGN